MPEINPYLNFDGQCEQAMRFYERTLGAKIEAVIKFRDSPMAGHAKPEDLDKVMHASVLLDGQRIMASDSNCGEGAVRMSGFGLAITYPSADEARRVFAALSDGGNVGMAMEPTFWAESFGMVTDKFGTPWLVNGGPKQMG